MWDLVTDFKRAECKMYGYNPFYYGRSRANLASSMHPRFHKEGLPLKRSAPIKHESVGSFLARGGKITRLPAYEATY